MDIDVGKKIAGKYELVRLLGKGAMGEVWLATHDSLGGEFAVKLVRPSDDIEDETAAGRFQLEAQVSAKLSRKTRHIVSVSDHGEEDGLAYLVMEVLEGESLEARLKRERLDLPEVVGIVSQIGRALSIAHAEGIFHRDLKPANVYLTKDEDGRLLVKLLDFGIARVGPGGKPMRTRSPFATGKDMVLGTPSYMSPEQARGLDSLDYRCDVWALAVVAYEALTRKIPWSGETVEDIFLSICTHKFVPIRTHRAELPAEIEAIFTRAFAAKLAQRFAHASELAQAFETLVAPEDVDAAIGGRAYPSSRRLEAAAVGGAMQAGMAGMAGQAFAQGAMAGAPGSDPRLALHAPSSDALAVAVGGGDTIVIPKRGVPGWLFATVGGVVTVGIIVALLLAFGSRWSARGKTLAGTEAASSAVAAGGSANAVPAPDPIPPPEPPPSAEAAGADAETAPTAPTAPTATAATSARVAHPGSRSGPKSGSTAQATAHEPTTPPHEPTVSRPAPPARPTSPTSPRPASTHKDQGAIF
jgi:serine/threonine-protein kinase